jgi:hypothetical protein
VNLNDIKTITDLVTFCNQNPWMIMIFISLAIVIIPNWISKTITSKLKGHDESIVSQVSAVINTKFIAIEQEINEIKQDYIVINEKTEDILQNCRKFNKCKVKKNKEEIIKKEIVNNKQILTEIQSGLA